jgi:hypothetical protein
MHKVLRNLLPQLFQPNDIYQAMTLVGITAILFPAFIGFVNVFNSKELE